MAPITELRVPTILIFDMVTGRHIGESRIPQTAKINRIVAQSVAPDMVAFTVQFQNAPVAICTARFHESDWVAGKQVIDTVNRVQLQRAVVFPIFQDGIFGFTTEEEVIVQQWDKPETRWKLDAEVVWVPRGLQIAQNRLLVLECKDDTEEIKSWRIRVFDISVVRNGVAQQVSEDEMQQLHFIDSVDMPHAPVEPFYAPYWEDRIGERGVHFGFKTLLLMHTEINEDGDMEERLTIDGTYIVGQTRTKGPRSSSTVSLWARKPVVLCGQARMVLQGSSQIRRMTMRRIQGH